MMHRRIRQRGCRPFAVTSLALTASLLLASIGQAAGKLEYNRDIRPILAEHCFSCHGPDSASRKAGLRLDLRDDAIAMEAIVPGKADKSEIIARIFTNDPELIMPQPQVKKPLTDAQKALLKKWVEEGAEYQPHWAFIPPKKTPAPAVKQPNWVRNPIDAYILAAMEAKGLAPAPEADRYTLARRLSLDLTGVPPTPQQVLAFVNDKSPDYYEKYVDSLLASPKYGEHRGRTWLDAARYGDTHGIHFDNYREMWSYREWVIRAFNQNQPFDQFTVEQLAGDLLPNPTLDQKVATGFNRCNITTNEGGAIAEEYLVLYTRDRTETTSAVWLGMTTGCAVCHDHKFDPFSQREFYSLAAFFNNTTQGAMDGNIRDTPPTVFVPNQMDRDRWMQIERELASVKDQIANRKTTARKDFDQWFAQAKVEAIQSQVPNQGIVFDAPFVEGKGKDLTLTVAGKERKVTLADGPGWIAGTRGKALSVNPKTNLELADVGDFDGKKPFSFGGWIYLPRPGQNGAVFARMDPPNAHRGWDLWIENDRIGTHLINKWPDNALKVVSNNPLKPKTWQHVWVTYDGSGKSSGVKIYIDGVSQPVGVQNDTLKDTIQTTVPFKLAQRHTDSRLNGIGLQDVRIYDRNHSEAEVMAMAKLPRIVELLAKPAKDRKPAEVDELFTWWITTNDETSKQLAASQAKLQQEEAAIRSRGTVAHVMNEKPQPAMAHVLHRGEYDRRRDPVPPATPKILPAFGESLPKNRLGLAKWLLQPDHPLTSRVTVNRFWQEVFGTGIVRTTGDFGITGELPSHPELLDFLAIEFREKGWDVKQFFKMLVTSSTYRQAAITTPEKKAKDPANRLLSRGPRFRMDAEMIRDSALAVSGLLVPKIGGPSVKPYQPEGVWEAVAMIGSDTRDYRRDSGENLYRRSMYTLWKRAAPPASMEIFNAPNRETCVTSRERTNTPLQALVTLNDVQFVEAARHLATRVLKEGGPSLDSRLDDLALRLLSRPWRADEKPIVIRSLNELAAFYAKQPEEAKKLITVGESKPDASLRAEELAAWTMLCNQLMNLDEVLCK
ncbi:DUF1553 domain-containing protein [Tuwongella immobilis]|uniref:Cytochrome c domain-containing protein n=1 Tax=Tuwongella immobilis TaxID=692036 RepID=A0A6C2YPY4_9BACT|nr:DUF1553 domain-containing protein [Tuwongella immobilis]VIP03698.1 hypothetical protein : Uncharacterized protein OS=Singulisphaera acidiphila (strain ATCC BAA-1392 / DSM 18658 / VKM B-2454 / MOB10) GN=Sinac_0947 PE=4 SV=1: PSCyt1: PSCyt2: Laminin_G_3: PSD1 [Tuwongella immobilis]VTS04764.1 hypothetical protein : Uncharacterized protein OS=Singulisphaera acidiphila (strain ATCC BAA-1392 / DSM 18658 / VKM B-2454 / MOB10) GN=Sinac_0947 PE=4 SV=1: PSCyt1: PSCyt2: Laminin_G_3: PSD1 [Tuwongella immo